MIDRLRRLWNRPIADVQRQPLFAFAVGLLLAVTAGLVLMLGGEPEPPADAGAANGAETASAPIDAQGERADDPAALPLPSEEEPGAGGRPPSPKQIAAAKRAARVFLAGYLPYTYGERGASAIDRTTAELRHALAAEPPRVPPVERRRAPRIRSLYLNGASADRAAVLALIDDGERSYTVALALARYGSEWRVTEVGS